jgi:hypothetical protein
MVETSVVPKEEEKKKAGLKVLGYVVPWLVVVLVLVVLVAVIYGEYLKKVFQSVACPKVIAASVGSVGSMVETPVGVRQFFRR